MTHAVEFRHVSKTFRCGLLGRRVVRALDDVSLAVPCGSIFAILGPNRAGKTTLVKTALTLCRPTAGTILRFGFPADDRGSLARVGYLHESQAFPRYLFAVELLKFYGALATVPAAVLRERIPQLLEEVGLTDRAREPIAHFSKGMAQRLALAQALLNDPDLLVLDEPSEGMDLSARHALTRVLRQRQAAGKTAILVSHSLEAVGRLCDHVAVLRRGQLAFSGRMDELLGHAATPDDGSALEHALEPMYAGV